MTEEEQARAAMAGIAELSTYDGPLERLGGLTNIVFRAGDFCLRIPGKGTEEYIDRVNEAGAARATAAAGVSPEVVYADPESGVMVTRFIEGVATMNPDLFKSREGSPARAGQAFRTLHDRSAPFDFRFELFSMIDDYLKLLGGKTVDLPEGYHDVLSEAEAVRAALAAHPLPLAPCHCDPLCENLLDGVDESGVARMWIVDWEYSGMNDPVWDLSDLSVEGAFEAAQEEEMLAAYFGRDPGAGERGRFVIYKAMCDLLWTLWGLIQHANDNPAEDFWAYSVTRFERCKTLMADESFAGHVAAVRDGRG